MNRKKILFFGVGGGLVILAIVALIIWQINARRTQTAIIEKPGLNFQPEFMTAEEKAEKGISTDLRVQAMSRNASGTVMVYKIIRSDSDIKNPAEIKAISPRQN
ncbi:MAG: hypothetical protein WC467_00205 [Patescibacteria group bacterium]